MIVEMIIVIPEAIALYFCNSSLHFSKMISTVCFLCNDIVQLHRLWIAEKGVTITAKSLFLVLPRGHGSSP